MGRRITDLDRFVDEFTGENGESTAAKARKEATDAVYSQSFLYNYAWAERTKIAATKLAKDSAMLSAIAQAYNISEDDLARFISTKAAEAAGIASDLEGILAEEEVSPIHALSQGMDVLADPQRSPLTVKKEFFDPDLVQAVLKAGRDVTTLKEFGARIRGQEIPLTKLFDALASRPPQFTVWSGVRERSFRLKPEEFFFAEDVPLPDPIDFMLQIAFTSAPRTSDQDFADTEPWEFPHIRSLIQQTVTARIAEDEQARAIYESAREFTLLQRFFRLGFAGALGDAFPVEEMGNLARALRQQAPPAVVRTYRWNAHPGLLEVSLLKTIEKELSGLPTKDNSPPAEQTLRRSIDGLVKELSEAADHYQRLQTQTGSNWPELMERIRRSPLGRRTTTRGNHAG